MTEILSGCAIRAAAQQIDLGGIGRDAIISECGKYRYLLQRSWDYRRQAVCFIMLNPSTADALKDDPTIRRCIGFARALGFGQLEVVNLFGWRATDPKELTLAIDPIGTENDTTLIASAKVCNMTICAWGVNGGYKQRDKTVIKLLRDNGIKPYALRLSKHGHPSHPLYLPASLQPTEIKP